MFYGVCVSYHWYQYVNTMRGECCGGGGISLTKWLFCYDKVSSAIWRSSGTLHIRLEICTEIKNKV